MLERPIFDFLSIRRMMTSALFLIACSVLWSGAAFAQTALPTVGDSAGTQSASPDTSKEMELETRGYWYGWQTLSVDALGASLVFVSTKTGHNDALALLGVGCLGFGAAAIHIAHRNWVGLSFSLGMRIVAGVAAGGGFATLFGDGSPGLVGTLLIGSLLVGLAAVVLDVAHFGFEQAPRPRPKAYVVVPWAHPNGAAGLQLMAAF